MYGGCLVVFGGVWCCLGGVCEVSGSCLGVSGASRGLSWGLGDVKVMSVWRLLGVLVLS